MHRVLGHFLTASVLTALCSCWNGDVEVTSSVTGVIGSCVFVPCHTDPFTKIEWYMYQTIGYPVVYSGTDSSMVEKRFKGRTLVPGNFKEGNCTLRINNIQKDDHKISVYVWIYMDRNGKGKGFAHKTTQINVAEPRVQIKAQSQQVENKVFHPTCDVLHSCPSSPPEIKWSWTNAQFDKAITRQQDGLWVTEATAAFRATYQDNGSELSCEGIIGTRSVAADSPVRLDILYAPKNIQISFLEKKEMIEGHDIILSCNGEGKPLPHSYKWHVISYNTVQEHGKMIVLKNVSRDSSVSCTIVNAIGQSESEWLMLDVHFPPSIQPESFCSDLGETLQCVCQTEAHPEAQIVWIVDGRTAKAPNFSITSQSQGRVLLSKLNGTGSNVTCKAQNHLGYSQSQLSIHSGGAELFVWPIAGAASAGLFLVAAVTVMVIICCKKKKKQSENESLRIKRIILDYKEKLGSTEELYVNTLLNPQQSSEEDTKSCIYENYG